METFPLAASTFSEEEQKALLEVIQSGQWTMAEKVRRFEHEFAEYLGSRYAVMVNSGSSANLAAIGALRYLEQDPIEPGSEVIVPAIAWATTYAPLQQYGYKLKVVDIDPTTLNVDVDLVEEAITSKTRAIVAVNILGNPCELTRIQSLSKKNSLYMIEDNCESLGATLNNKKCGTFGDIGTHSFFFSHHISTAEGGMITTDNEELYHLCLALRAHGWTRDLPEGAKLKRQSEALYDFALPGYNLRPTEFAGALGSTQLMKLNQFLEARRQNASYFLSLFENSKNFQLQVESGSSSWFGFTFVIQPNSGLDREKVFQALRDTGIAFRLITGGSFTQHQYSKHFDFTSPFQTRHADWAHHNGFFVGNFSFDCRTKIDLLYSTLKPFI